MIKKLTTLEWENKEDSGAKCYVVSEAGGKSLIYIHDYFNDYAEFEKWADETRDDFLGIDSKNTITCKLNQEKK